MNNSSTGISKTIIVGLIVVGVLVLSLGGYLNPVFQQAGNPFVSAQTWISNRFMAFYDFFTVPRDVASLREQNAALEEENSRLQAQVIDLQQQIEEASVAYALLGYAHTRPENQYLAATVIGRDPNPFMSYIIIDKGSDQGIITGMPIVNEQGLVGRVSKVTPDASSVQLITDSGSAVNVLLQSSQTEAILAGSSTGELSLDMIPQDIDIENGELVLTSGLGGNYPSNIMVGQVTSVRKNPNDLFQEAVVQPVIDFSSIQAVLVITNFTPVDISPLVPDSDQ